jgi:capsular polysaccharide biosynthesis protein
MNDNTPDEINLMDYIQILRKRKWLIILGTLICIIAAVIISLLKPKVYRGEATFKILTREMKTAKEMVNVIGNPDEEKLKQILPKSYNLVNSVKLSSLRDSTDKFKLIIEAKRFDDIPIAISEFEEYVDNNPLIRRSFEENKEMLLKQTEELSKVIESSKELVKAYDNLIKTGRLIPVGFNPIDLNKRISDIKIEKLLLEQSLRRLKGIEMVTQPYISSKPVKPKKRQNVMIAGVVGLLASIMLAFFIEFLEKNKMNLKNLKNSTRFHGSSFII